MSDSLIEIRSLFREWHAATLPVIIRPMPVNRFTLRRMTAALLPLSFLWLCVACAFICGRETTSVADHPAPSSVERAEAKTTPVYEGCPFASFPKATAPERAAFDAGPQTPAPDVPPSPPAYSPAVASLVRPRGPSPPAEPPLQPLPTLRI